MTHVEEDPNGTVYLKTLLDAIDFEYLESGNPPINHRVFTEYIMLVFPQAKKERISKDGTTVTFYDGIVYKNIANEKVSFSKWSEVESLVPCTYTLMKCDGNYFECSKDTFFTCNGSNITKIIKFKSDMSWQLEIASKTINLEEINISNTFEMNKDSILLIFRIVDKINLCEGHKVTEKIVMTRFHLLESQKCTNKEVRKLRSILCKRVVALNSKSAICRTCQRMTILDSSTAAKENTDIHQNSAHEKENIVAQMKILFPGASKNMIILLSDQASNLNRAPNGRRWSQEITVACLQMFCRSPQAYKALRATKLLILPSPSTLILYKTRIKHKPGLADNLLEWMYEEAKRINLCKEGWIGGIVLDEISIQADIQISKTGEVVELCGFVETSEEAKSCQTIRTGKNRNVVGTHILQFIFLGITGFRFPFVHYVTDGIQAPELFPLFWDAVDRLKMFGFSVLFTSLDGAQANRNFMHYNIGKDSSNFKCDCPMFNGQMIFIMDICHVIKKIRNNIIKSGISKTCTRLLTLPSNETIQWQMFIDTFNWDKRNAFQLHQKLTNEHFFLSNQSKMRNFLAEDVLGSEMLHLMVMYQQHLGDKGKTLAGAIELLNNTSQLINIFKDMRPIISLNDERLKQLETISKFFNDWKEQIKTSVEIPAKEKNKKLLSLQCMEDIQSAVVGFKELCTSLIRQQKHVHITPGLINSDVVENTFNQQRSTYSGANTNPNALQYRRSLNSIILGQNIVSQKANAGNGRDAAMPFGLKYSRKRSDTTKDHVISKMPRL